MCMCVVEGSRSCRERGSACECGCVSAWRCVGACRGALGVRAREGGRGTRESERGRQARAAAGGCGAAACAAVAVQHKAQHSTVCTSPPFHPPLYPTTTAPYAPPDAAPNAPPPPFPRPRPIPPFPHPSPPHHPSPAPPPSPPPSPPPPHQPATAPPHSLVRHVGWPAHVAVQQLHGPAALQQRHLRLHGEQQCVLGAVEGQQERVALGGGG